jgi:hypothetical protein
MKDGQIDKMLIGLLDKPISTQDADLNRLRQIFNQSGRNPPTTRPPARQPIGGGNQLPGGAGTSGPGSGGPGIRGGETGGGPGVPGSDPNAQLGNRADIVVYKTYEEAAKLNLPPALTLKPVRMAVVQLSFPLKEQLEEIKRALRLRNLTEAINESGPAGLMQPGGGIIPGGGIRPPGSPAMQGPTRLPGGGDGGGILQPGGPGGPGTGGLQSAAGVSPVFEGIEVRRRQTTPTGQSTNWEVIDHEGRFWDEFVRFDAPFVQESGMMPYFIRPEQRLTCPMPLLADGIDPNYPPTVRLSTIYANAEELKKKSLGPKPADEMRNRFQQGSNNPYAPSQFGNLGGQFTPGLNNGEGNRGGGGIMPGLTPRPMMPGSGDPQEPMTPQPNDPNKIDVEHLLLRFIDTDLRPGYSYEYQVRVRMRNPNYQKKDNVARDADALIKEIEGAWYQVPQKLTVPTESFLYATDSSAFEKAVQDLAKETNSNQLPQLNDLQDLAAGRRAVVQMQQWFQQVVLPGDKREPVGSWVVVEMPVTPGEYIGRRTYLQLPLWSAGVGNYTFRALSDDLKKVLGLTNTKPEVMPKGYFIHDFRTKHLLIDFHGGKSRSSIGGTLVNDEAASELLILRDDGKIEVRNEMVDTNIKERKDRDQLWAKWLKEVKARNDPNLGNIPGGEPGGGRTGGRTGGSGSPP